MTQMTPIPGHVPADRVVDFDVLQPEGVTRDFHLAWRRLQTSGAPDIVWTPRNGGHWIATRGRIIADVFADYEKFSSKCFMVPREFGEQYTVLPTTLDPPEHRPFRILLNSSLSPKAVQRIEGRIRALAGELVDDIRPRGQCDFITEYAEVFPVHIFMMMVDLPAKDAPLMKRWSDQVTRPDGSMTMPEVIRAFSDYLEPYVNARLANPGDDMLSRVINGTVDGRPLEKQEAMELSIQILIAGLDTVVNFLGFAMLFLAQNPVHRQELVQNPDLIPAAVDELFRRFPMVIVGRLVRQDIVYGGVELKAGEMIMAPTLLHGLDDRENECPVNVDFQRREIAHSTFGNGSHRCPGAHLARTEVIITLEEWLSRIPDFSVSPGHEVVFRGGFVGSVEGLPLVWDTARAN